jgi:NAD(P)-dependent dehydrogenase (short-subunit alcohol dehydrogenase family)
VERCADAFGRLDGLVNAAGIWQAAPSWEITPAEFDRMFAINVGVQRAAAKGHAEDDMVATTRVPGRRSPGRSAATSPSRRSTRS